MRIAKLTNSLKSDDGINYLNIFLMLISCFVSFFIPFELFLFAYSILGPLHYLTEISWLEKKNYFMKSKSDIWLFVLMSVLLLIGILNQDSKLNSFGAGLVFIAFMFAFIIMFINNFTAKLLVLFSLFFLFALFGLNKVIGIQVFFAILLPTVIHVFIFTGAFILFGALKTRSISGIISFVVFMACAVFCFAYRPDFIPSTSDQVQKTYKLFAMLNQTLSYVLGIGSIETINDVFNDSGAIAIMRFIAFAYTYHYLNWFSKTSVIKWHEISKKRMSIILVLWVCSVGVYMYDYKTGFFALFFLSILHVFMEFPLNYHSFIGIGKEVGLIFKGKSARRT